MSEDMKEKLAEAIAEEQEAQDVAAEEAQQADAPKEAEAAQAPAAVEASEDVASTEAPEAVEVPAKPKSDKLKWYIAHAHSGFEKKVAVAIKEQAEKDGMGDMFGDVVVPTESVVEVKRGKKVNTERKFFPGYVLVQMDMNDRSWHLVKNTPKVTGFIGGTKNRPQPISESEAEAIFQQIQDGMDAPRHKVTFMIGDSVKVIDGPFDSFIGTIEGIDEEKEKLSVSVSIFGRPTPLELEYTQVDKV